MTNSRPDVYTAITEKIVAQLEAGVKPWLCPWQMSKSKFGAPSRPLRSTGQPYSGVNVLVLWLEAQLKSYTVPVWLTFNQAKELGGFVKKGEKSTTVVYANSFEKTETDAETGEEKTHRIPFLKTYYVFNVQQIEGLESKFYEIEPINKNPEERLDDAEQFFKNTGFDYRFGGNRAFYSPTADFIQLPLFEHFNNRNQFYATMAHESIHMSGAEQRLNRQFGKRFGDDSYAFEELVAELGSAFLCADLGISPEIMEDHASYLSAWLKILKKDSRALFTAASQASRAVEYLHGLQNAEK